MDWENAEWDEVARGCERICNFMLRDFRASQRASWMECMVGSVYHIGTQAKYLHPTVFGVLGCAGKQAMLQQLDDVWHCLAQLGISMRKDPEDNSLSFTHLPSLEWID